MYNDVLPMSHRESLEKYPLDSALAYNNCMFLAHECLQIFVPIEKLPESLKQRPLTFGDLVPKLRQTGVEIFMEQMKSIKDEFQVLAWFVFRQFHSIMTYEFLLYIAKHNNNTYEN